MKNEMKSEQLKAEIKKLRREHAQDIDRATTLRREIGMLRKAHGHLSGIPEIHNETRIKSRETELESLEFLIAHVESLGIEEVARIDLLAKQEGTQTPPPLLEGSPLVSPEDVLIDVNALDKSKEHKAIAGARPDWGVWTLYFDGDFWNARGERGECLASSHIWKAVEA